MSKRINPPTQKQNDGLCSKGWGPFRCEWYSFCSGHGKNEDGNYYGFDTDCSRCMVGSWINCWMHEITSFIYDHTPELWRWWVNRPHLGNAGRILFQALKTKMRGR